MLIKPGDLVKIHDKYLFEDESSIALIIKIDDTGLTFAEDWGFDIAVENNCEALWNGELMLFKTDMFTEIIQDEIR
jgi:hypothetical protein